MFIYLHYNKNYINNIKIKIIKIILINLKKLYMLLLFLNFFLYIKLKLKVISI